MLQKSDSSFGCVVCRHTKTGFREGKSFQLVHTLTSALGQTAAYSNPSEEKNNKVENINYMHV